MIVIKRKCTLGDAGTIISSPTRAQRDFARRNPTVCKIVDTKKPAKTYAEKPNKSSLTKSIEPKTKEGK